MIGPLTKIFRASNLFKFFLRYFGKVRRKSNMWIIQFYWLIALYLFTLLPHNMSFLIVKNCCVREEVSDVNKSLCKNIFLVSSRLCTSPLVHVPPQLKILKVPTTPSTPRNVRGRQFPTLGIWQSPEKFTGKRKTKTDVYVYIYIAQNLRGQWHSLISRKELTYHQ